MCNDIKLKKDLTTYFSLYTSTIHNQRANLVCNKLDDGWMELVSCKNKIELQHTYLLQHPLWSLEIQPKVKGKQSMNLMQFPLPTNLIWLDSQVLRCVQMMWGLLMVNHISGTVFSNTKMQAHLDQLKANNWVFFSYCICQKLEH